MARYLYSELASKAQAWHNCDETMARYEDEAKTPTARPSAVCYYENARDWRWEHSTRMNELTKQFMPSGSGFDNGTFISFEDSHGEKLVFRTSFHHMNENGFYDGWTEHIVTVTPSFSGTPNVRISGRNRNDIKEYIAECFLTALTRDIEHTADDDPFKNVPDYDRCVGCYGKASITVYGKRYCSEACATMNR